MIAISNPYDTLPYKSLPIEWTAFERLALAYLLHGGPRPALDTYRVLELGRGNGANLLPLAYYRRHATFVGVDGAGSQIEVADARKSALELSNIEFIHTGFVTAAQRLSGQFDYMSHTASSRGCRMTSVIPAGPLYPLASRRWFTVPGLQYQARLEGPWHGEGVSTRADLREDELPDPRLAT